MSRLALAIIAKDEVELVKAIIEKHGKWFDEIAVAVDQRVDEFKALADEKVKIHVYEWRNDFAHKRNWLAERVEAPYYFRMDTDDDIENPQLIPTLFSDVVKGNMDILYVIYDYAKDEYGNTVAQHWRETIIKKRPGMYWKKAIHENIFMDDERSCRLSRNKELKIIHNITGEHALESTERNFKYLMAEFKRDGEKTDPRTIAYLGRMCHGRGLFGQAILFLEKLVEKSGWEDDKYFAWVQMSQCYQSLGKLQLALSCCNEALMINTKFPDAYIQMGCVYIEKQDFTKAVDWLMSGIVRPEPDTVMVIDPSFYRVNAKMAAVIALIGKGELNLAQQIYAQAKKAAPKDPAVLKYEPLIKEAVELDTYIKHMTWLCMYTQMTDPAKLKSLIEAIPKTAFRDERAWKIRNSFIAPRRWGSNEITIFCGQAWEEWSPISTMNGIGGSEEAVIYQARELTKLGYKVTVFNSCGDMAGTYDGVDYVPWQAFNTRDTYNILISWRGYDLTQVEAVKRYVWLHDVPQPNQFTPETIKGIDKILVLSAFHKSLLPKWIPEDKIFVTANGINQEDFKDRGVLRNPHRMIHTSSYDRGIEHLLMAWPAVREAVPDAELHLFYGWNTYDEMVKKGARDPRFKEEMVKLMSQPGVTDHGRVGHRQLVKEFQMSGIWVYPSHFEEISCISAMKAQASGCVPVSTDYAALAETVKTGIKVKGQCGDEKVNEKFKEELIQILKDDEKQEALRQDVLTHKEEFGWDKVALQWHTELFACDGKRLKFKDFEHYREVYQHRPVEKFTSYVNGKFEFHQQPRNTIALDLIAASKATSLLDVGCGDGTFCFIARDMFGADLNITGIDIKTKSIETAKKHAQIMNVPVTFVNTAAEEWQTEEKFDIVSSFEVLEHVYDPRAWLNKLESLVKDDGYIILSTPDRDGTGGLSGWDAYHVNNFNEQELKEFIGVDRIAHFEKTPGEDFVVIYQKNPKEAKV